MSLRGHARRLFYKATARNSFYKVPKFDSGYVTRLIVLVVVGSGLGGSEMAFEVSVNMPKLTFDVISMLICCFNPQFMQGWEALMCAREHFALRQNWWDIGGATTSVVVEEVMVALTI